MMAELKQNILTQALNYALRSINCRTKNIGSLMIELIYKQIAHNIDKKKQKRFDNAVCTYI